MDDKARCALAQRPHRIFSNSDVIIQLFIHISQLKVSWDWIVVSETCRLWRAIVAETPVIWSYFHDFNWPKRTERCLRLSKDADLKVYFQYTDYHALDGAVMDRNLRCLEMVLKEMRRVKHLDVYYNGNCFYMRKYKIGELLQQPAPRIHTICVQMNNSNQPINPALLRSNTLRYLTLSNAGLSGNISSLRGLRDLAISLDSFSLTELLTALVACPGLHSLYILFCDVHISANTCHRKVLLPILKRLRVRCYDFNDCVAVLQNIEASELSCWDVFGNLTPTLNDIGDIKVLSNLFRKEYYCSKTRISASKDALDIVVNRDPWLEADGYSPGASLSLSKITEELQDEASSTVFDVFQNVLGKTASLQVGDHDSSLTLQTYLSVVNRSLSARDLTIILGSSFRETKCINALIIRDAPYVPCPKLAYLSIEFPKVSFIPSKFLDLVETMLRSRSEHGLKVQNLIFRSSVTHACEYGRLGRLLKFVGKFILECSIEELYTENIQKRGLDKGLIRIIH